MCQQICLRDNLPPVQAMITKFGPGVQNNLVKIMLFSSIDLHFQGQIELQNQNLPPFWTCPPNYSPSIEVRTNQLRQLEKNTLVN